MRCHCDTIGQKHSRLTRLERFVILPISSCSPHPFMPDWPVPLCHFVTFPPHCGGIVHRTRGTTNQLTAAYVCIVTVAQVRNHILRAKRKRPPIGDRFFLAPQTGLDSRATCALRSFAALDVHRTSIHYRSYLPVTPC